MHSVNTPVRDMSLKLNFCKQTVSVTVIDLIMRHAKNNCFCSVTQKIVSEVSVIYDA